MNGFTLHELNSGETVVIEYQLKATKQIASITHYGTFIYAVKDLRRDYVTFNENTNKLSFSVLSSQAVIPEFYKRDKFYITFIEVCPCCKCCHCCNCCCYCKF